MGRDLFISMATQGGSALLGLALVKLSVIHYSASEFGQASLILGVHNLLRSILLQPFLQYFLFHYWDQSDSIPLAKQAHRVITWNCLGSLPVLWVAMILLDLSRIQAIAAVVLVFSMAWVEGTKTLRLLPYHLRQEHGWYGFWTLLDAAARPVFVVLFAHLFGPHALSLVAGHVVGGILVYALLLIRTPPLNSNCPTPAAPLFPAWRFLLPIAVLGITAWISGLSDRYFLAHRLGTTIAGHYAAIYGLFGAPFVIYATAVSLVVRPKLNAYLLEGDPSKYLRRLWAFLPLFAIGSMFLAALLVLLRSPLVFWMLKPDYRHALSALPGILVGQFCMTLGVYLEMHFYLQKRPYLALIKQGAGALAALISIPWAIQRFGLPGAGWACAFYYGVDVSLALILTAATSKPTQLRHGASGSPADPA